MKAFHNDVKVKAKYLKRVRAHIKADHLIRGVGWENGKGCAVGCTLENYNHAAYETELGIPEWLARVEDTLFEGMSLKKSKTWPAEFLKAIKPGVDLNKAKVSFIVAVLQSTLVSMSKAKFDADKFPQIAKAIEGSKAAVLEMIRCHKEGLSLEADSAAYSAADSARSAARSAADSARSADSAAYSAADSADSAYSAADSAARSARSAAYSAAYSAADSARSAADSAARSARSADSAARSAAAYDNFADRLLKILKGLK